MLSYLLTLGADWLVLGVAISATATLGCSVNPPPLALGVGGKSAAAGTSNIAGASGKDRTQGGNGGRAAGGASSGGAGGMPIGGRGGAAAEGNGGAAFQCVFDDSRSFFDGKCSFGP